VDHRQRIIAVEHVKPGERPPGPPDQIEGQCLRLLLPSGFLQHPAHLALQLVLPLAPQIGNPQHPERKGKAFQHLPVLNQRQLQTAATQITDNPLRFRDAGNDAKRGQLRLFLSLQNLYVVADQARCLQQVLAVAGIADRRRGKALDAVDFHFRAQAVKALQSADRQRHGFLANRPGRGQFPAQASHHLFIEQYGWHPDRSLIDNQADRIGTDINDRRPLAAMFVRHLYERGS